ncbi:MAG: AsmA family protein [Candidatus Omnitrophota bacterium]
MKKFFITVSVIFALLAVVLIVFALTFDANRYKGVLIEKLEESMARDVIIDNISLNILRGLSLEVKGISIKDKDKTWDDFLLKAKSLSASVKIIPLLKKDIQIERLSIPELEINTGTGPGSPVFRCALDIKARILINDALEDDVLKALSAKGNMKLRNAVLDKMNILKTALDKLNMLPGVTQKLKDNMPEEYGMLLNQDYTAFEPISADFEIRDARIYFDKLLVESDTFYLSSKGSVGMTDQSLQLSSTFFIPKGLSGAFIKAVPEFEYLTDTNGLITMPLEIKGKIPNISVMPDLNYVLQRLIASKGRELLNKLFKFK